MLKIKILEADGAPVTREELITLYASDMNHVPFRRKSTVMYDGTINLEIPGEPVMLHAKLVIPGYGFMWISADNCGAGYRDGAELDYIYEAALSRVAEVEAVVKAGEFTPSVKCLGYFADAKGMIEMSAASDKPHKYNLDSLVAGMWAGDLAAVERARARIARAPKKDGFLFGCGGFPYPYPNRPEQKALFDSLFNFATLPFYLAGVEREFDKPDYTRLDALQDAFEASGIPTKAHPMWWPHLVSQFRPWMEGMRWSDGSLQREIDRVIKRNVSRYKGRIKYYDAINEAHDWCNVYNLTHEEQALQTKACCDAIHDVDPTANAIVNTCFMFGENVADGKVQWGLDFDRIHTPYTYLEQVHSVGTEYDTVGIQLYNPARDMLAIDKLYDRFAAFGKPIHLTELGVPAAETRVPPSTLDGRMYALRYMYHGYWHGTAWNETLQADWIEDFYTISYSHPEVEALTWWNFEDPAYIPGGGMVARDGKPRESMFRLKALEESWGFNFNKK